MMPIKSYPERRGSVYIAVLGTVSVVTILALSGVAVRKSLNERARLGPDTSEARMLAQSAAELAIHGMTTAPDTFKATAETGILFEDLNLGTGGITATVIDVDTAATPTARTTNYRVTTDASAASSRSRLSFDAIVPEDAFTTLARELGAIAYWPLDEATGSSVAEDRLGTNPGTYIDPDRAGVDTHVHGNASPQNDWVTHRTEVPHNDVFLIEEGTIAFWVCWDHLPSALVPQMAAISKESVNGRDSASFFVTLENGGNLVATITDQDDAGGTAEATGVITAGQWHHIALTWDNQLCLFVDGVEVDKNSGVKVGLAEESGKNGIEPNTAPWMFGVRNKNVLFTTPAYPTFGSVARVVLFDTELKSSDIADLYAASSASDGLEVTPGSFARVVD